MTQEELNKKLKELFVRFNTSPKTYEKYDFLQVLVLIRELLYKHTGITEDDLKTVNDESLVGHGNVNITPHAEDIDIKDFGDSTNLRTSWSGKQDAINDLDDIRSGAVLGATALQSFTETDPTVPSWAKAESKPIYTASEVGALPDNTSIPSKTSDLQNDSGFLTSIPTASSSTLGGIKVGTNLSISDGVLSATNTTYTASDFDIKDLTDSTDLKTTWSGKQDSISDLQTIREGAALGATALQSFTESDPTVPSWAKASSKPSYTASEVGALPDSTVIPDKVSQLINDSGFITSIPTASASTIGGVKINGNNLSIDSNGVLSATDTTYSASDFDIKDLTDSTDLRTTWSGKQDTLTAGTNISITGTTISATDTTYQASDFDLKDLTDSTNLKTAWNDKQDALTAGTNISISGTTISATDTTYIASDFDIKDLTDSTDLRTIWNGKQDALTAGTNISISGSTISATDTTYSATDFDIKDLADTTSLRSTWSGKQDVLTAGDNITINNNTIAAIDRTPIGAILMWPTATAPTGWLICNGQSIAGDDYAALRTVLGTDTVPDLSGKFILGVSSTHALNSTGGEETHTLDISEMPNHSHPLSQVYHRVGTLSGTYSTINCNSSNTQATASDLQQLDPVDYVDLNGGGGAHNNMPPYFTMNFIIKYQ